MPFGPGFTVTSPTLAVSLGPARPIDAVYTAGQGGRLQGTSMAQPPRGYQDIFPLYLIFQIQIPDQEQASTSVKLYYTSNRPVKPLLDIYSTRTLSPHSDNLLHDGFPLRIQPRRPGPRLQLLLRKEVRGEDPAPERPGAPR